VIENTHPSSLGVKVLQSLTAQPVHTHNLGAISATGEWRAPLCPSLRQFGLKYRRWLRTSERFDLIPKFESIIRRRQDLNCALQSFRVWTRSDQEDALELVENSWISAKGFERLANEIGIKVENVLELVPKRLVQSHSSLPGGFSIHPPNYHNNDSFLAYSGTGDDTGGGPTTEHRQHLQVVSTRRVLQPNPEPWITADANDPSSEEVPSNYGSTGSPDEEDDTLTIK